MKKSSLQSLALIAAVTEGGLAVTGSVTVAVKEINSASDMILGDKPTLTNGGTVT